MAVFNRSWLQSTLLSTTRPRIRPIRAALVLSGSVLLVQLLFAQPGQYDPYGQPGSGSYTMRKQVIGAGEVSSGGPYRLIGTVGEVGAEESTSPRFHLIGGFHGPTGAVVDSIYCDSFENTGCP